MFFSNYYFAKSIFKLLVCFVSVCVCSHIVRLHHWPDYCIATALSEMKRFQFGSSNFKVPS